MKMDVMTFSSSILKLKITTVNMLGIAKLSPHGGIFYLLLGDFQKSPSMLVGSVCGSVCLFVCLQSSGHSFEDTPLQF